MKIEDAFLKGMEAWLDRRRKFNNLFETVLEGTGEKKQKLWGDSAPRLRKTSGSITTSIEAFTMISRSNASPIRERSA